MKLLTENLKSGSIFLLFFFLFQAAIGQIDYANPGEFEIADIAVEGAEYTDKFAVVVHSGLRVGDKISIPGTEISEAIKKLYKQKLYSEITLFADKFADTKVWLRIVVVERPRIQSYSFPGKGGNGPTNGQVNDIKEKINFIRGSIWTEENERRASRIIRNYYVEKGFYNAKTNYVLVDDTLTPNYIKVNILVNKGKRVKINRIRIDGNQEFSDARLKAKMKEIKEKRFWRLWERSKLTSKDYGHAKENLIEFYNSKGFRDARILEDSVYLVDEKHLEVAIRVFEGNQYYFRNINWVGNYKYSTDTLALVLGIEKGDVYSSTVLDKKLRADPNGQDVSSLYLDDGYLFFNIDPVEIMVEGDSIDIEMRIQEGPQATIRKVIVEGNTKTSDYVILRELRTIPGQKFSRTDLIRSQREIINLGYFNQENLQVIPIPNPADGTVDIKYIVEEKSSDQFQVQGGWGGQVRDPNTGQVIGGGFVGTVSLAFNNFSTKRFFKKGAWRPIPSGDGQKLSLAIQMNGVGWQNYSISFLEPWLGGKKPNSLGASLYYSINRNPSTDFRMNTFGSSLDYGIRMKVPDDYFRSYTSLGYKNYFLENASRFFGDIAFDNGSINIITLTQSFDRTSIDAPLYPRSGSSFNFSVEATPPYSIFQPNKDYGAMADGDKYKWLEYHKWSFSFTWYKSIWKNLVIRPKIQLGYLGTYRNDYGISPFERYLLGGSGFGSYNFFGQEFVSLRGYQDNSIGPRSNPNTINSVPLGGNIYNKYSLELRYPITLNQAAPIWMVGFFEAGNAWLGFKNYKPFDLKRSAGLGIRVVVPMVGLLGVDYGHPFDKVAPDEQKPFGRFNFVLGKEF